MDSRGFEDNPELHTHQPHRYLNKDGRGVIACVGIFYTISIVSVALRYYSRYSRKLPFLLEDYVILAALCMFTGFNVVGVLLVTWAGMGWHSWELPAYQMHRLFKLVLAAECLFASSLGLVKISIILFIYRAFSGQRAIFRICGGIILTLTIMWIIATVMVTFLLCRPVNLLWSLLPANGMCGDPRAAYVSIAAIDIFVDLLVIALPQPVIWKLHLPVTTKLAITGIVGMGLLSTGMGVARMVGMIRTDFLDFTTATKDVYWSLIEISTGIFTCCAPSFQLLFRKDRGSSNTVSLKGNQTQITPYEEPRRRPWFKFWRHRQNSVVDDAAEDLPLSYYQSQPPQCTGALHRDVLSESMSSKTLTGESQWTTVGTSRFASGGGILVEKSITTY